MLKYILSQTVFNNGELSILWQNLNGKIQIKDKYKSINQNWKIISSLNVDWKIPLMLAWHLTFYSQLIKFYEEEGLISEGGRLTSETLNVFYSLQIFKRHLIMIITFSSLLLF